MARPTHQIITSLRLIMFSLLVFTIRYSVSAEPPRPLAALQETLSHFEEMEFECEIEHVTPDFPTSKSHIKWQSRASEHLVLRKTEKYESVIFTQGEQHFSVWSSVDRPMKRLQITTNDLTSSRQRNWQRAGLAELTGGWIPVYKQSRIRWTTLGQAAADGKCAVEFPVRFDGYVCAHVVIENIPNADAGSQIQTFLDMNAGCLPRLIRVIHDGNDQFQLEVEAFDEQKLDDGRIAFIPKSGTSETDSGLRRKVTIKNARIYQGEEASKWQFPDVSDIPVDDVNNKGRVTPPRPE